MAENVYTGLANFGKLKAQVGLGISICLALSLCVSGAYTMKMYLTDKHTAIAKGVITSSSCPMSSSCQATANYTVNGKTFPVTGMWPAPLPSSVDVAYNPENPGDSVPNVPSIGLSVILILAAICIFILGYIVYVLTMAYKPLAAAEGAKTAYNIGKALI